MSPATPAQWLREKDLDVDGIEDMSSDDLLELRNDLVEVIQDICTELSKLKGKGPRPYDERKAYQKWRVFAIETKDEASARLRLVKEEITRRSEIETGGMLAQITAMRAELRELAALVRSFMEVDS